MMLGTAGSDTLAGGRNSRSWANAHDGATHASAITHRSSTARWSETLIAASVLLLWSHADQPGPRARPPAGSPSRDAARVRTAAGASGPTGRCESPSFA